MVRVKFQIIVCLGMMDAILVGLKMGSLLSAQRWLAQNMVIRIAVSTQAVQVSKFQMIVKIGLMDATCVYVSMVLMD